MKLAVAYVFVVIAFVLGLAAGALSPFHGTRTRTVQHEAKFRSYSLAEAKRNLGKPAQVFDGSNIGAPGYKCGIWKGGGESYVLIVCW